MYFYLKKILKKIGVDRAIFFTSASSIFGTLGNVLIVILVINLFTDIEQGFYYTFGSILSIQIFFELGFNNIITQFAAHEVGRNDLKITDSSLNHIINSSRLSSLFNLIVRWYSILFVILFITLLISGIYFFKENSPDFVVFDWEFPWIFLVFASCLNFLISPFLAFLTGVGQINIVSRLQFIQNVIKIFTLFICLLLGFKLLSIGLSLFASTLFIIIKVYKKYFNFFYFLFKLKKGQSISYFKEIFPYQWRIAISWISGYFIFQIFNPVLFATEGPKVAGQMGMTLAGLSGLSSLSLSWITTKIPLFSNLISSNKLVELNSVFKKSFFQALLVNIFLLFIFLIFVYLLKYFNLKIGAIHVGDRFIDFLPLVFMVFCSFINQIVNSWAIFLRCFKKEPYLINSIVGSFLTLFSTIYFGNLYGLFGITLGYFIISIMGLPWAYFVFKKNKV
jgi:O-antigen/teichoic acid export membrane protein